MEKIVPPRRSFPPVLSFQESGHPVPSTIVLEVGTIVRKDMARGGCDP
jgi:hypothetical protein